MLAAVLKDFNNLALEDIPVPDPGLNEVVVQVKACGICATDYKAITGIRTNVIFPFIPGHEASGVVAAVGPGVRHVKEGDEVICQPSGYCGVCEHCRAGNTHYCDKAFTTGGDGPDDVRPGAFAEYMKTDAKCLLHKPAGISFKAAALTEPLSGAWKGVIQYSELRVGDDVVIIGVGGIGLLPDFGITTHETFMLDGGLTHFLEGRMDASFGTTPLAMQKAVRLMERGMVDPEAIITHHFALADIQAAIQAIGRRDRNKIMVSV